MPLTIPNEVVRRIIGIVKEGDNSDPKKYAWVLLAQPEDDPETMAAVNDFRAKVNDIVERLKYPRFAIIKFLLENKSEEQMLLEFEELHEYNAHVILLFSKNKEKVLEQAEYLQNFLSDVEDVEVLYYVVNPNKKKE
jgi:adenylate kinase family enzyme